MITVRKPLYNGASKGHRRLLQTDSKIQTDSILAQKAQQRRPHKTKVNTHVNRAMSIYHVVDTVHVSQAQL